MKTDQTKGNETMEVHETNNKSQYAVYGEYPLRTGETSFPGEKVVYLIDLIGPISVTSDAEEVVRLVAGYYRGRRIAYRDSNGQWGELCVRDGEFNGFGPWMDKWHPEEDEILPKIQDAKAKINSRLGVTPAAPDAKP